MTSSPDDSFQLRNMLVRQVRLEAEDIVSIQLVNEDGTDVPDWAPGAHIDLILPSGLVRQYSLCGDPADRRSLMVAVLREHPGRGGSAEVHDSALVGRALGVRGPRNHFALVAADSYLFVAGGVGITPVISMVRQLRGTDASFRLVYGGRSRRTMAFLHEAEALGPAVEIVPEDESGLPDLPALLDQAPTGTHVYCCGPEGLLRELTKLAEERDIPVHLERFGASAPEVSPTVSKKPNEAAPAVVDGDAFEVELRRTGITVEVQPGHSILETVREHVPVISSCEEGYCGSCETRVLEGIPEHHDEVLSEAERAANQTMMICVGRSCSPRLVLDL